MKRFVLVSMLMAFGAGLAATADAQPRGGPPGGGPPAGMRGGMGQRPEGLPQRPPESFGQRGQRPEGIPQRPEGSFGGPRGQRPDGVGGPPGRRPDGVGKPSGQRPDGARHGGRRGRGAPPTTP